MSSRQPIVSRTGAYEPIITRYCLFCKTPHCANRSALEEKGCVECASPLFPPAADLGDDMRRAFSRTPGDEEIGFYTFWPGPRLSGRLLDLSPAGLRFLTPHACRCTDDVIKIEAKRLQAVGAIVHEHRDRLGTTAGIKFCTVGFRQRRGSFVSAQA